MRTVQLELLRPGEILAERERCSIVYLPVGPLEWHGPAMPYGTDALLAQSLARCAAERTGGVVMPTLFIGTERERPASILRDKGFENPEQLYVLGMDVPKNSMKSFYAREDMFAVIVREHLRLLVQQGYRLIVIVNGHGAWGQTSTLERLAVEFSNETPSKVIVGFPQIHRLGHRGRLRVHRSSARGQVRRPRPARCCAGKGRAVLPGRAGAPVQAGHGRVPASIKHTKRERRCRSLFKKERLCRSNTEWTRSAAI